MEFPDYYKTLGVERVASAEAIKKAYRKLARKYHPDVSKEPDAEARMKELNEAFAVLSDPEKRAAYDDVGKGSRAGEEFRPPPGWDTGFEFSGRDFSDADTANFSDFFAEIFGKRMHAAGGAREHVHARGTDRHAKIALTLEDAYHGATRDISLRAPQLDQTGHISMIERTISVRIPKGVHEGQLIRLAGQGNAGVGNGPAGDLYLEVHFTSHSRYRTERRDVYATLPITPWEAALGASIQAKVPDGTVEIQVPQGSQSGRKLRLKGRGIPGSAPGDFYFVLEVMVPPANTPRARELYEAMAHDLAFNPREPLGV